MNLFRKQTQETSLVCKICKMEFTDPERTVRHMIKAHSKPQKAIKAGAKIPKNVVAQICG